MTYVPIALTGPDVSRSTYSVFVQFPVVCFTLTLLTDIAYLSSENLMWHYFSAWLLLAGVVFAVPAAIAGLADIFFHRRLIPVRSSLLVAAGSVVVFLLAVLNSFIHAGDGWTAVYPWGVALSAITLLAMVLTYALLFAPVQRILEGRS